MQFIWPNADDPLIQQLADHSVDDLADASPAIPTAAAQRKLTSRGSPESKKC
jgi:hypothetical protein